MTVQSVTPSAAARQTRQRGASLLKVLICLFGGAAVIAAMVAGNNVNVTALGAFLFVGLAFAASRVFDKIADHTLAFALIGQTSLITAALSGHPWQIDSHMIYFAALATLILLLNPAALITGAALIALHHGILSLALPTLVYPSADILEGLMRTALHGTVVVMETAVLVWVTQSQLKLVAAAHADNADLRDASTQISQALESADDARTKAQQAQERAEHEASRAQAALADATAQAAATRKADAAKQAAEAARQMDQADARDSLEQVVTALSEALAGLAAKDLTHRLDTPFPGDYEKVRSDYNAAIASLTTTVTSVKIQVEKIKANAADIAHSSLAQSEQANTRARSMSEVSGSVRDLEGSIALVASNAAGASERVKASHTYAHDGMQIVAQAVGAMNEIDRSASEIGKIVSLIEDISFQTNLLSLNAGVEAARAGEAGRGFAVVATEVRALAQRSTASANEIKQLISESNKQVKNGVDLVQQSGAALEQILTSVAQTNTEMDGINESVQTQNTRLASIAEALETLSDSALSDQSMINGTATIAATLDHATDILSDGVSIFQMEHIEDQESAAWQGTG